MLDSDMNCGESRTQKHRLPVKCFDAMCSRYDLTILPVFVRFWITADLQRYSLIANIWGARKSPGRHVQGQ